MKDQHRNAYTITTDASRIPVESVLALLRTTYWAGDLQRDSLARAMANSLCFGLLGAAGLVGFARVITDRSTFAYLTDVVIEDGSRGKGLGRWLMECVLAHPDLQGLRRFSLLTSDAMDLYRSLGFEAGSGPLTYMERR